MTLSDEYHTNGLIVGVGVGVGEYPIPAVF